MKSTPTPPLPKTMQEIQTMCEARAKKQRLETIETFRKQLNVMIIEFGEMDDATIDAMRKIRSGVNDLEEIALVGKPKHPIVSRDSLNRRDPLLEKTDPAR